MRDIHSVIMSHMAEYLYGRRRELGMSLADVAKRAGSTKAHIWSLEHGRSSNPTLGLILALCDALQCDMSTLMASPMSLPAGQTVLALEKTIDFIESLTNDPLLLPDDIEMTLSDVQRHARIELASIRQLTEPPAISDNRKFDTARTVTEAEIRQWASTRADDAGYLARKLVALWSPSPSPREEVDNPSEP
jgi:transcriptional regulator with XRE-family HTH domain